MQATTQLVAILLLAAQPGPERVPDSARVARVTGARVTLIDAVSLPALQAGVIRSLHLEDGTRVQEGVEVEAEQVLGKLDDREANARQRAAQLEYEVALAEQSKATVTIKSSVATQKVAEAELRESEEVNQNAPGSIPKTQIRRQELTIERASSEVEVAKSDSHVAEVTTKARQAQVEIADLNVERHSIRSPLNGQVISVYRHVGEWVQPGDPILKVVRLDQVRVEGFVALSQYAREEVDKQPVTVTVQLSGGRRETFEGRINFASPLIQASGEFRVICELENRRGPSGHWILLPGMPAEMDIELKRPRGVARR